MKNQIFRFEIEMLETMQPISECRAFSLVLTRVFAFNSVSEPCFLIRKQNKISLPCRRRNCNYNFNPEKNKI